MGIPEGEEREKGTESVFKEIIVENSPNLEKKLKGRHLGSESNRILVTV